eukprot:5389586-Pyramimonas_sp.AAC.1
MRRREEGEEEEAEEERRGTRGAVSSKRGPNTAGSSGKKQEDGDLGEGGQGECEEVVMACGEGAACSSEGGGGMAQNRKGARSGGTRSGVAANSP